MNCLQQMPLRIICIIALLGCVVPLHAQTITIVDSQKNQYTVEAILLQEKSFSKDTLALRKYLAPLTNTPQHQVLYHALLANGYSQYYDASNIESKENYLQSIVTASKLNDEALLLWAKLNYVSYLYKYRDYEVLTPLLLEVMNKLKHVSTEALIFPGESYKKVGWIMQTIGDYNEALKYFDLALRNLTPNTPEYCGILDAIGICNYKTHRFEEAENYFNRAFEMALKIDDYVRIAKVKGNLAIIYQANKDYDKAISFILEDIAISEKFESDQNTMFASIILGQLYIATKQWELATQALDKAERIAKSKDYFKSSELEIIKLKLQIIQHNPDFDAELSLRRRMNILDEKLRAKDGKEILSYVNWVVEKQKYQENLKKTETQVQQEAFLKNIYFIISGMVVILAAVLYLFLKNRLKNRQLEYEQKAISLELEKLRIEQNLTQTKATLDTQVDYLKNKNVQIKKLKKEIEEVKQSSFHFLENTTGKLNSLLESHLMTDDNWLLFKRQFQKEYPGFFRMLQSDFPEISDAAMRILLLQKMNFSTVEIAELLGITPDAVKKSKQRLKKKLGGKYEILADHINPKLRKVD